MRVMFLLLALAIGCASGGQWGHSRTYEPLSAEQAALDGATDYDPVMAARSPEKWRNKKIKLFGIVLERQPAPGGLADVTLSVRVLESRNLCESNDEDSCRVTVSDREYSRVHGLLKLQPDDDIGATSVGALSLLRLVGELSPEVSAADGAPVVRASYYRHWPRNYYVTTKARSYMRQ